MENFPQLGLSPTILDVVRKVGYTNPTPIQRQAIPQILCGHDIFGCAQTGTGKTAAFLLPIIDVLHHQGTSKSRFSRAIILEPTRELAAQVLKEFEALAADTSLKAVLLVGGELLSSQKKQLNNGADVLIVTPGRLLDLVERGSLILAGTNILVIDEADRMLDMGFIPDVERIVSFLPSKHQTLFFSATVSSEVQELAKRYLHNPKEITITPTIKAAATVQQFFLALGLKEKLARLTQLLKTEKSTIIFCNRKRSVGSLASSLRGQGFAAQGMHGDMPQSTRNQTLADFHGGKFAILVASDIAARGLDVEDVSLVINYDVPTNPEEYIHRIGRTGRAGRAGKAITFVTTDEQKLFKAVEDLLQQQIQAYVADDPSPPATVTPKRRAASKPSQQPLENVVGFGKLIPAFMQVE